MVSSVAGAIHRFRGLAPGITCTIENSAQVGTLSFGNDSADRNVDFGDPAYESVRAVYRETNLSVNKLIVG